MLQWNLCTKQTKQCYNEILIWFYWVAYINVKLTAIIFHSTSYKIQYLSLQQMLKETMQTTLSNIWLSFREKKHTKTYQVTNHDISTLKATFRRPALSADGDTTSLQDVGFIPLMTWAGVCCQNFKYQFSGSTAQCLLGYNVKGLIIYLLFCLHHHCQCCATCVDKACFWGRICSVQLVAKL